MGLLADPDDRAPDETAGELAEQLDAEVTRELRNIDLLVVGSRSEARPGHVTISARAAERDRGVDRAGADRPARAVPGPIRGASAGVGQGLGHHQTGPMAPSWQDQVAVAELVPQVAVLERCLVGALEQVVAGDRLEHLQMRRLGLVPAGDQPSTAAARAPG